MSNPRILVVEDDPSMQRLLSTQLLARGYDVVVAYDGKQALRAFGDGSIHLVLLDITLPDINGLEVCRRIRALSAVPIILVTAADLPETKVTALDLGADDYLTKPFHTEEMVARIRAVLRRTASSAVNDLECFEIGDLTIDLGQHKVSRGTEDTHLTKIEFALLRELVTHANQVLTYERLLETIWGPGYSDIRAVHVHISNLRHKIEQGPTGPRYILAMPGVGYRLRLLD
jgi:two-component system, OmpR family, response regulator MtrA